MRKILLMLTVLAAQVASATSLPALTTLSEQSGFTRTGRYAEVIALCDAFAKRYPQAVKCHDFGVTPEGRPMKLLVASKSGALTPERARQLKLPVVLVQGGIHSGEIDGKDAGFWALRDLLEEKVLPGALKQQVLLFVPVFNIDGHERFGKWNRPNQRGPEEMGWRTTAQNYNLNREYVKADAPEMQAMLRLVQAWDPLATIDLHVTDGAKFEHDIGIIVQPSNVGDEAMRKVGTAFRDEAVAFLARNGSLPLPFYPAFIEGDNPASGIREGVPPPRLSHGYFWLKNRMCMLVETHSWKDYPARVKATRNAILSVLEQMARHGRVWLKTAAEADARAAQLGGKPVALAYKVTEESREIEFRGYAYTRTPSDISGALMTRYDESKPEIWKLRLRDKVTPQLTITAPGAGYLVPPAHAALVKGALDLHGVQYRVLKAAQQGDMEAFRATKATSTPRPVEQRQRMTLEGAWKTEPRSVAAGALFVPIAQANARLAMSILEPAAPDSLASWGSFNIFFERREYMEPYVAEDVAREMLARDPALDAAFAKRLADDAEFAKSPTARLDFFYQRHSSWDDHFNLYPVYRVNQTPH